MVVLGCSITTTSVDTCLYQIVNFWPHWYERRRKRRRKWKKTHCIVKVASCNGLLDRYNIIWRTFNDHLHSVTKLRQLISDISHSAKTLELDKIFVAKLLRIIAFCPLLKDVEESKVITARLDKVFMSFISMHTLIFRTIKERAGFLKHWYYCENLWHIGKPC